VHGAQGTALSQDSYNLVTAKHYLADGGTRWGTSSKVFPAAPLQNISEPREYFIDQGDSRMDEDTLRRVHLAPYVAAIKAGAQCVMASFSSWNGRKMHGHYYLLTQVLKEELGFSGFIVSDWGGMDQITGDYYMAVVQSINAGVDMNMVPFDFRLFIDSLTRAVVEGDVSEARIDDAVRRILTVKYRLGLFAEPVADDRLIPQVGSTAHRELAREAAAKSIVLLKNRDNLLPLPKSIASLHVAGQWADDIGLQCGGWTIAWLGQPGNVTPGTTILAAIRTTVTPDTTVDFAADGVFERRADIGLAVVGEMPYAEGFGDRADLTLPADDVALIERVRGICDRLIVIVVSGRPLILTEQLPLMDALVAVWLPGSEGQGVADVLFGERPFIGKLPYSWPRSMAQVPLSNIKPEVSGMEPLFPFGFGLE
jgi:beta-glucosidase